MSILARSWLSVQAAILLTATTSFPDLAYGLRHLYIPEILVSTISFMVRYLHVLSAEASRLMKARAARSARLPGRKGGGLLWRARVTGNMIGQLFVVGAWVQWGVANHKLSPDAAHRLDFRDIGGDRLAWYSNLQPHIGYP
jgi:hypothetical protein